MNKANESRVYRCSKRVVRVYLAVVNANDQLADEVQPVPTVSAPVLRPCGDEGRNEGNVAPLYQSVIIITLPSADSAVSWTTCFPMAERQGAGIRRRGQSGSGQKGCPICRTLDSVLLSRPMSSTLLH